MLERVKEVGSLGEAEHKPGNNGNIGFAVKQSLLLEPFKNINTALVKVERTRRYKLLSLE